MEGGPTVEDATAQQPAETGGVRDGRVKLASRRSHAVLPQPLSGSRAATFTDRSPSSDSLRSSSRSPTQHRRELGRRARIPLHLDRHSRPACAMRDEREPASRALGLEGPEHRFTARPERRRLGQRGRCLAQIAANPLELVVTRKRRSGRPVAVSPCKLTGFAGGGRSPHTREVAGSNPAAPIDPARSIWRPNQECRADLLGNSATRGGADPAFTECEIAQAVGERVVALPI